MISIILVIVGTILILLGILGLLRVAISPILSDIRIVFSREDDDLKYESEFGKFVLQRKTQKVIKYFSTSLAIGVVCFALGFFWGFSERGKGFLPYKILFARNSIENQSDHITKDGKYKSDNGKEYTYYIKITKDTVSLNGEEYTDLNVFNKRLSELNEENAVVLIDDFAVSSTYHSVEEMLKKMAFKVDKESN